MTDTTKLPDTAAETTTTPNARRSVSLAIPEFKRPKLAPLARTSRFRSGLLAVAFLLTAILGGIGGGWLETHREAISVGDGTLARQKKVVSSQSQLISQIAKTVGPSVVSVNVTLTTASALPSGFESLFGYSAGTQTEAAAGTGIIISAEGIIITNRHVVPEGTNTVSVTLSDGTELKDVTVIGRTKASDPLDIAFLKIANPKGHHLKAAQIGDSSRVQVGDDVVAIGNALGQFQNTVTSGILSGFGRSVQASSDGGSASSAASDTETLDNLFQTDAAINEGNSGGPLVNLNGQVIGINTAIAGNAQNIGFSIPINDVKGLITQVLKNGKVVRPYLGVRYVLITADFAKQNNLSVSNGAYILPNVNADEPSVIADSPAAKAGLQAKDIITKVGSATIDQNHSLTSLLSSHQPNEKVSLTIIRDGKTQKITVALGETPTN
ncbi:MAG: trypsin-like peptidase domain-containing protein [Patescibacteria group bacterium]|nr:trypsin-like peptidase domain-containing protein [Patescibacteria group bacterium]